MEIIAVKSDIDADENIDIVLHVCDLGVISCNLAGYCFNRQLTKSVYHFGVLMTVVVVYLLLLCV